eukprot:275974-Prorocentrum_minimum.AAC.1
MFTCSRPDLRACEIGPRHERLEVERVPAPLKHLSQPFGLLRRESDVELRARVQRGGHLRWFNIQGTFKEHSRNIQGTFKEHSRNIQATFKQGSSNVQATFKQRSSNVQATFKDEHSRSIPDSRFQLGA